MVLYYSATGNTSFVAKQIARRLGDESLNLLQRIKDHDFTPIESEKPYVICAPVHICDLPIFLAQYLKRVPLLGNKDVYFVFTSGGYAGISASRARWIVKYKKMHYMGRAEFTMPRNYPVSRRYEMLPDEENIRRLKETIKQIPKTVHIIKKGGKLRARYISQLEKLIILPFVPIWVRAKHSTQPFYTTDKCVGCGLCERLCPLNRIHMVDGRPKWDDIKCAHCMACLGNCPKEAIEYRDRTEHNMKYRASKYIKRKYV